MGDGGIISGLMAKVMGKSQVVEEIQEGPYAGAIRTGQGNIAKQLTQLDLLEQGQGGLMSLAQTTTEEEGEGELAVASNQQIIPKLDQVSGTVTGVADTQEALLQGVRKEVWDPINIPSVSYPNRLDLRKTDPMRVSQIEPKSGERTVADIEALKAYGPKTEAQTGGMVPDSNRLQETGIGFPAPEVRSALYKQPLAPVTEQMQRAKLGAALGQVPIPEKQNNLPTPQYPGEPMGKPEVYGGGLTDEMPKDEIDAGGEAGDVIINNKAMIRLGLANFKEMTGEAVDIARRLGFSIGSRLDKLNRKDITDLLVSKGEGRVPQVLAKIVGLDRLRKINDRGKEMIVAEEKAAAQQKEKQKYTVKKRGVIPEKKAFSAALGQVPIPEKDVVEGKKKSLNELEPHKKEFITNAHQVVNEVNIDNIIPSPVILSMIALETGYGTSRFANEGNNWLNLAVNKPDQAFLAAKERPSQKLRSFNNPAESIQAFLDMVKNAEHYAPVRDMLTKYATGEASEHDIIDSIASTKYAEDPEWSNKIKSVHDGRIKNMFIEQEQQVQ